MQTYALTKAIEYVSDGLGRQAWHAGERLPALGVLARDAGVSRATMWKAIGILKQRGLVVARRGSRVTAGGSDAAVAVAPERANSWQAKRMVVERDILAGSFEPGAPFPPLRLLQLRYGVCHATLRKILQALVVDRVIDPLGNSFTIPRMGKHHAQPVVCLLWESGAFGMEGRPLRESRVIEALQKECSVVGSALLFLGFRIDDPRLTDTVHEWAKGHRSAVGFIIRPTSFAVGPVRERYVDMLIELSRLKKPIAILDEHALFSVPQPLASNPLIKVFRIADMLAGKSIGRMLLSLGHRRVAFISQYHGHPWANRRYQGVAREFAKAGYVDAVPLYAMENPDPIIDILMAPSSRSVEQVVDDALSSTGVSSSVKEQLLGLRTWIVRCAADIEILRRHTRALARIPPENLKRSNFDFMIDRSTALIWADFLQVLMGALFEQASTDRAVTAWVGVNDAAAVFGMLYLRSRGMEVPREISVAGFDGDPEGFGHGLTSYDFDFPNVARQILGFIVRPMRGLKFTKDNCIEVPGFTALRSSTAVARVGQFVPARTAG